MAEERTIEEEVKALRKEFGQDIIIKGSDKPLDIPAIPTGSLNLDRALGVGGVPRGRVSEIFGPEGGGKTTLAQHIVAEAQRMGGKAVYIDLENAVDAGYMSACGVDMDELYLSQPNNGEEAWNIMLRLVRANVADVIVLDSVSALVTAAEKDSDAGSQQPGIQARLMSSNLRKIVSDLGLSKTALIFINQLRMKIGVMFGSPETTSGGRALKFYTSVRMRVRNGGIIKDGTEKIGQHVVVKVAKNKVAPPLQEGQFDLLWGKGIDGVSDVLATALITGVIKQGGGFYAFEGERIAEAKGKNHVKQAMDEQPALVARIRAAVLSPPEEADEAPD